MVYHNNCPCQMTSFQLRNTQVWSAIMRRTLVPHMPFILTHPAAPEFTVALSNDVGMGRSSKNPLVVSVQKCKVEWHVLYSEDASLVDLVWIWLDKSATVSYISEFVDIRWYKFVFSSECSCGATEAALIASSLQLMGWCSPIVMVMEIPGHHIMHGYWSKCIGMFLPCSPSPCCPFI